MRLFVALDPPESVLEAASAWGREVARGTPGLRPVGAEAIHLTLAFLGSRDPREVEEVVRAIETVSGPVDDLEGGAPVWLPRKRPRALALEVRDPSGELARLRAALVEQLGSRIEWRPERRGFLPHLTVARASRGFRAPDRPLAPSPALLFDGVAITLFRSHLDPAGARYEALFSCPT